MQYVKSLGTSFHLHNAFDLRLCFFFLGCYIEAQPLFSPAPSNIVGALADFELTTTRSFD
jgi:hypothetical protein